MQRGEGVLKGKRKIVAERYAKSLIELAAEAGDLDGLFSDMVVLSEAAASTPHFLKALSDERIKEAARLDAAGRIAAALRLRGSTTRSLKLLIVKHRIALLPHIAASVITRIRQRKKLALACAQVADRAIAGEVKRGVEEALASSLGMKVECEVGIEPGLIGGFVVSVGDMRCDASVRGRLTRMKEEFFAEAKGL